MAKTGFLRRSTRNPGGWAAGGGDTGWDYTNQLTWLSKVVLIAGTAGIVSAVVPKGTIILAGIVHPYPLDADSSGFAPASAGTIAIGTTSGGTNIMAATNANVFTRTAIANGLILTSDTRIFFTPNAALVGVARAAVEVLLPLTRR